MPIREPSPVYEEWASRLVPSNHDQSRPVFYRVFWGTVNWDRSTTGMRPACTVFMQYGESTGWDEARQRGEVVLKMPAHILAEDFEAVVDAMRELASGNAGTS